MINCFKKIILQMVGEKNFFERIRRKMCCFEEKDIEQEAGNGFFEAEKLPQKI